MVQERLHGVQAMFANKLVDRLVSVSGGHALWYTFDFC